MSPTHNSMGYVLIPVCGEHVLKVLQWLTLSDLEGLVKEEVLIPVCGEHVLKATHPRRFPCPRSSSPF